MTNCCLMNLRVANYRYVCGAVTSFTYVFKRKTHYDIAVVGGGLVGTAMACAVAKNPMLSEKNIVLFESSPQKSQPKKSPQDPYSNRVVSLNPGSKTFLESIGVWNHISDVRYKTVKKLQVWDACSDALITFNDDLVDDVSYIVENDLILFGLESVCSELNKITVSYNSKIKNVELPKDGKIVKLEMENGDKYTCNLLIGAEGANSRTRQILGCQYLSWNYNQKGVVATLKLSEPFENIVAWQRFLPTGPVALLPLTDELSSLVWSIGTKEAEELLQLSEESFVDAVNDAFWKPYPKNELVNSATTSLNKLLDTFMLRSNSVQQLPPSIGYVFPNSRAAFPLGFGYSTKFMGPGVALVGDAAHRVHPLAGQGLNLGFKDVECLTEKLSESVSEGKRLGSWSTLSEYESERQRQLVPMLVMIDFLQKLYTTSFTPAVLFRSLGLQITNAIGPIKKQIISQASV